MEMFPRWNFRLWYDMYLSAASVRVPQHLRCEYEPNVSTIVTYHNADVLTNLQRAGQGSY